MSKPKDGTKLPSNLNTSSSLSKPRLLPRRTPARIVPPQHEIPKANVISPEAQQATEAANTKSLWETIIRRKKFLGAVAFAVVTVAGALLGARIKETRQEYGKRQELEEKARKIAEAAAATGINSENVKVQDPVPARDNKIETTITNTLQSTKDEVKSAYSVDVAKQIALLEDRKALLNRQRANFEMKIQSLYERKARREAMEARRPPPVQVDR